MASFATARSIESTRSRASTMEAAEEPMTAPAGKIELGWTSKAIEITAGEDGGGGSYAEQRQRGVCALFGKVVSLSRRELWEFHPTGRPTKRQKTLELGNFKPLPYQIFLKSLIKSSRGLLGFRRLRLPVQFKISGVHDKAVVAVRGLSTKSSEENTLL